MTCKAAWEAAGLPGAGSCSLDGSGGNVPTGDCSCPAGHYGAFAFNEYMAGGIGGTCTGTAQCALIIDSQANVMTMSLYARIS